jgi:hypothetical protein
LDWVGPAFTPKLRRGKLGISAPAQVAERVDSSRVEILRAVFDHSFHLFVVVDFTFWLLSHFHQREVWQGG